MRQIKVGDRLIGLGQPCFVIAEAGVNHNGDLGLAKKLIDVAVRAKADAVKFQTFRTELLVSRAAPLAKYQRRNQPEKDSQYDLLKALELSLRDHKVLSRYSKQKGIIFLSSPFDEASADLLEDIGVPAFKIGSGEITNLPLLEHIARKNLPVILSTGYSTLQEVTQAVKAIENQGNRNIVLLHCTANYPTRFENVNLLAMQTMMTKFKYPVGYSDHTLGVTAAIAAVALGAVVIEKHFTLDRNLPGPDHKASATPGELKWLVKSVREITKALGSPVKEPTKSEAECIRVGRKSIIAGADIPRGARIGADMLTIKRPGTGIHPGCLEALIGRVAKRDIARDIVIKWEMIK